jgi:hypothetical protein
MGACAFTPRGRVEDEQLEALLASREAALNLKRR